MKKLWPLLLAVSIGLVEANPAPLTVDSKIYIYQHPGIDPATGIVAALIIQDEQPTWPVARITLQQCSNYVAGLSDLAGYINGNCGVYFGGGSYAVYNPADDSYALNYNHEVGNTDGLVRFVFPMKEPRAFRFAIFMKNVDEFAERVVSQSSESLPLLQSGAGSLLLMNTNFFLVRAI